MHDQLRKLLTAVALGALTLSPLACDGDGSDDPLAAEREAEVAAEVDAMFEAEQLASEAREAGVEIEAYVCQYGEAPELIEVCAQRARKGESPLAPELELATAPSEDDEWSCVGHCGGSTSVCFCDSWCWLFGDCCWDYEYVCE